MPRTLNLEELFYPGNRIRVECYDDHFDKKTFRAVVYSFLQNELVLEINDMPGDFQTVLKTGLEIALICRHQDNNLFFSSQVTAEPSGSPLRFSLNRPARIQIASRRNFFRCSVNLKFSYFNLEQELTGRVHNLSACGLYAVIGLDRHLALNMLLPIQLYLPTIPQPLKLEGKIVRMESLSEDQQGLALNFENCPESIQNKLTKYLFQRQRELIKRGHVKLKNI